MRALTPAELGRSVLLGLFLGTGFLLQTTGLTDVSAAVSGFLTGTMVVLTPVVAALVFGERVGAAGWAAVAGAMCGIALMSLRGWSFGAGTLLTVGGAACFAFHIAGLSRWATPGNAYGVTAVSVSVAAGLSAGAAVVSGGLVAPPTWSAWRAVTYLALVATCAGFAAQAWAQSGLTAIRAAVIMTLEPVFAAAIALAVRGERLTWAAAVGGLLIVGSMFVAELGPRACCDAMTPRVECC